MIPKHIQRVINSRLTKEVGYRADVGKFLFTFTALSASRDIEYAMEELESSTNEEYKKGIRIVIDEIVRNEIGIRDGERWSINEKS